MPAAQSAAILFSNAALKDANSANTQNSASKQTSKNFITTTTAEPLLKYPLHEHQHPLFGELCR